MDKSTPTNVCAELLDQPRLLRPATGAFGLVDYEKAYAATTTRSSHAELEEIFDLRSVDRDRGILVFVRPPIRGGKTCVAAVRIAAYRMVGLLLDVCSVARWVAVWRAPEVRVGSTWHAH